MEGALSNLRVAQTFISPIKVSWNITCVTPTLLLKDDWPGCSWCQWMVIALVLRDTSSGSWTLSTCVCATQWKYTCLLVSAGTDIVYKLPFAMFFLIPLTLPLQLQGIWTLGGYLEAAAYPGPAHISWFSNLPASQMHPSSLSLSFVLFLFPTGILPRPKTHSSLHYCHASILLGSRS